jgi:hypothetical protein
MPAEVGMKALWRSIPRMWEHPLSALGTVITTVSACMLLIVLVSEWAAEGANVYTTGFLLLGLPALFVLGLLLIPLGAWRLRRRRARGEDTVSTGERVAALFTTKEGHRKLFLLFFLTVVNIALLAGVGVKAKDWMDSPQFCGTACHTVMQPEYESYVDSPHARVSCVQCHIGPGASFAVRSKLDGLRQVWRTFRGNYERPVPVPVHSLRPSRDTCEQCHWPDRFHGSRVTVRTHFQPDEANTPLVTLFLLHVGGRNETTGKYEGIHWHVSKDTEVRYEALDPRRERIGKVTVIERGQVVREYLPPSEGEPAPVLEVRTLDCIDCHNRPTHVFVRDPVAALNRGLHGGILDPKTPWIRKLGEALLARTDLTRDEVETVFRRDLEAAYREHHPESLPSAEVLAAAARGLAELWRANVYPARGVTWGTYPSHLGHQTDSPRRNGCFRCHDARHKTAEGKALGNDCALCHEMLVQEEKPEELEEPYRVLLPR